jgi:hypothetical protein
LELSLRIIVLFLSSFAALAHNVRRATVGAADGVDLDLPVTQDHLLDTQQPGQCFERRCGLHTHLAQEALQVVERQLFLLRQRLTLFQALL